MFAFNLFPHVSRDEIVVRLFIFVGRIIAFYLQTEFTMDSLAHKKALTRIGHLIAKKICCQQHKQHQWVMDG